MYSNNVTDSLELRKLFGIMSKECYAYTSILVVLSVVLVVHRRINDFEQLSVEGFFGVGRRCIDYNPIQVVEFGVPETRMRQRCVYFLCWLFLIV